MQVHRYGEEIDASILELRYIDHADKKIAPYRAFDVKKKPVQTHSIYNLNRFTWKYLRKGIFFKLSKEQIKDLDRLTGNVPGYMLIDIDRISGMISVLGPKGHFSQCFLQRTRASNPYDFAKIIVDVNYLTSLPVDLFWKDHVYNFASFMEYLSNVFCYDGHFDTVHGKLVYSMGT